MANPFGPAICFPPNQHFFQFTCPVISACTSANYSSSYFTEETEDTMWEQPHIAIHLTSKRYLGACLHFTLHGNKGLLFSKDNFSFSVLHLNPSTACPIGPFSFYSFLPLPYNHVLKQHKNILNFKSCFLHNWFQRNGPCLGPIPHAQFIPPPFHLGFIHSNCVSTQQWLICFIQWMFSFPSTLKPFAEFGNFWAFSPVILCG